MGELSLYVGLGRMIESFKTCSPSLLDVFPPSGQQVQKNRWVDGRGIPMHTDYLKRCSCIVSMPCVALASAAALHNGTSGYRVQLYLILTLK